MSVGRSKKNDLLEPRKFLRKTEIVLANVNIFLRK